MTFDEAIEYVQESVLDLDALHLVIDIINDLKDTYESTIKMTHEENGRIEK